MGKPLDSFKTLHEKRLYRKLMQILNDPTHQMRHYLDSRRSNKSARFFREQIQTVIKPRFYHRLCQFLMKIIPVINWVCACVKMSVEDDNFLREGWWCVNLMIFIWEFLLFGLTEKALWASSLCIRFYNNPAPLNGSTQFHYCTDSNPGTGADDAFVSKRGVWRNATWPSHSRPAIAASARHFQICFLP